DQTLDEVREALTAAWVAEKTEEAVTAEVAKAIADLKSGTPMADVAVGLNQFPELSVPLSRGGNGTNVLNAAVANAAFSGGEGHVGSASNGEGGFVVFQVVEITPAEGDLLEDRGGIVAETRQNTLYSDFMSALRDSSKMQINQQALTQLLALETVN